MNNICQCSECQKALKEINMVHESSCAVHNEPAEPKGKCDCRGVKVPDNK